MSHRRTSVTQTIADIITDWHIACAAGGYSYNGKVMLPGTAVITRLGIYASRLRAEFDCNQIYRNAQPNSASVPVCGGPPFSPLKTWRLPADGVVAVPQPGTPVVLPYSALNTYGWYMEETNEPCDNHAPLKLEPMFLLNWKGHRVCMLRIQETVPVEVDVHLADPGQTVLFPDIGVVTLVDTYGVSWERQVGQLRYALTSLGGRQQVVFSTLPYDYVLNDASSATSPTLWAISLANVDFASRNDVVVDLGALQSRSRKHEFTFGATPTRRFRRAKLAWRSDASLEWVVTVYNAKATTIAHHSPQTRVLTINGDAIQFPDAPYGGKVDFIDPSGRHLPPMVFHHASSWSPEAA